MAHVKFVSPSGWDFDQQIITPVKYGSRGLIGNDRSDFLKIASPSFVNQLDNIKFAKDEVPVHLIALGASEAYGPNRNGDGFKEATCRKYHPTFVKFAKFFRNHKNKPERGDPYYGTVKASAYNEDMRRVELICALNAEKSAADRTGGLLADVELEKIARGEDFPVSMACRVPHDTCSFCKHAAKHRGEYCTREKCAAGGCKSNLTRLVKIGNDLHHLHVDNPDPTWFDISRVFRPADRIAYGGRADYLTKAASDTNCVDVQEYIKASASSTAPLDVILYQSGAHGNWSERHTAYIKLAYALASLEGKEMSGDVNKYRPFIGKPIPVEKMAAFGSDKCNAQLGAMADRQIILSLQNYATLSGHADLVKSASVILPTIYSRMTQDESLPLLVESGACDFIDKTANEDARMLAAYIYPEHSLSKQACDDRSFLSCIRGHSAPESLPFEKSASCGEAATELAKDYAMYKLAALWRTAASDVDFPLTVRLSLRQNQCLV
jgi:hypothetical protein